VIETPDIESAEYKIDDEIEDLDTTIAIKLTASSSDTSQATEKAADSDPTGLIGFLLTLE
jgi:DNA-directed RNA polymerase subunit L